MLKISNNEKFPAMGFLTPPPQPSKLRSYRSPMRARSERKRTSPLNNCEAFHVVHKVPAGDSPYVRAKQVQLIEKDPNRAVSLFWSAINAGDRVDSALKDMAVVMKQLNRSDEAIEAIKSFRHLCPYDSQESIDNVLVELYKRAGRIEEETEMLLSKLKRIDETIGLSGRKIKVARSQGKKIHITTEQEKSRILGNLAWAYLRQNNYRNAEEHYRKALLLEPDLNKQCNLAICLMYMNRMTEAKSLLHAVRASSGNAPMDESYAKSYERAQQILRELEQQSLQKLYRNVEDNVKKSSRCLTFPTNSNLKDGEETFLLAEQHRENYCPNHPDNKKHIYGHDNKNLRCQSSEVGSMKCSQHSMSVCNWKQEYPGKSDASGYGFPGVEENWVDTVGTESSPLHRKIHCSPASCRSLKSPYTQPRRCLWGFADGDQRAGIWENNDVGKPNKNFTCDHSGDRRRPWGDAYVKRDAAAQPVSKPILNSWRNDTWENSNLNGFAGKDSSLSRKPTLEPQMLVDNATASVTSTHGEQYCRSDSTGSERNTLKEECSGGKSPSEENDLPHQDIENSQLKDSSFCYKKKSWADMVEEEELMMSEGAAEYLNGWSSEEEANDENLNSNIINESPRLQTQMKNVSQKFEFLDLKDGNCRSENTVSSRKPTVRRSLCFNRNQKPVDNFCSSPLPKKALNFEDSNSVKVNGKSAISGKNLRKPRRRNRLPVFQDITLHQGSP